MPYTKAWARARTAAGKCLSCSNMVGPARAGLQLCSTCASIGNAAGKERRAKLTAAGRCIGCAKPVDRPGKSKCSTCHGKVTNAVRRRREKRLAAGCCIDCGAPKTGRIYRCSDCASKARQLAKQRYQKIRSQCAAKAAGPAGPAAASAG